MTSTLISPKLHHSGIRVVNQPDPQNVWRLDRAAMPMIVEMEKNGIRVDKSHLVTLHTQLTSEMEALATKVGELTGKTINLGSGDQLAELLFKDLKLKQVGREKWTDSKKRLAADSDVLKQLVSQHPAIKPILDWKEREKLRSTYTYSLISKLDEDDRLHCDISSTTTGTGRLASSDPNLQNIPIRTKLGREIRNAFIPSAGNIMGTVDASQIEMRQNCHDSQCKNMMDIFWRKEDLYWGTAELMYRRPFTQEERKHGVVESGPAIGLSYKGYYRFNAKTTALMVTYDTSPGGLYDQFLTHGVPGWTEQLCAQAIIDFFAGFPELLTRRKEHHRTARILGFVFDMWGRVRWIPQVKSTIQYVVSEGLRQAGNLAGQGGAAGVIKLWMALIWDRYVSYWYKRGIRLLMQIHDEILSEGPANVMPDFLEECKSLLIHSIPVEYFTVPLESDSDQGDRWGAMKD